MVLPEARELSARALAAALALLVALGLFHPGGLTGDLLRAWVLLGAGALALLHAWHLRTCPAARVPGGMRSWLPVACLGLALALGLAQLVPLPRALLETLAPASGRLYALEDEATGLAELARPLSLDPVTTLRCVLLGGAYLLVFLAARGLGRRPRIAGTLVKVLAGLAALTVLGSLASLGTPAADAGWRGRLRAPFVNPNHLCTFLCLTLGLALGATLAPAKRLELGRLHLPTRTLAALAVILLVGGIVLTQSRAGVLAAGGAALATLLLAGALSRRRLGRLALGCAVLALGVGLSDPAPLGRRVAREAFIGAQLGGRLETWQVAGTLIAARPWGGAGLGSFDDASQAALDPTFPADTRPVSAHNDYLELAADLGLPGAGLILAGLVCWLATLARDVRGSQGSARALGAGALGGALGALAHAGADFALHAPAPALLLACQLGLAAGLTAGSPDERPPRLGPRTLFGLRLTAALLAVSLGMVQVLQGGREAAAQALMARASAPDLRADLRPVLAHRALPALERAGGWLAAAELSFLHAQAEAWAARRRVGDEAEVGASERVLGHARAAVAGAPGRARHQALLGLLLLNAWARDPRPELLREGEARLELAVSLGPTGSALLFAAGHAQLDLLVRRGEARHLRRAEDLLRRAIRGDARLRAPVAALLDERAAALGAHETELRRALGIAR